MYFSRSRRSATAMRVLLCTVLVVSLLMFVEQGMTSVTLAAPQATFTVNNVADAVDANPGDGICATAMGVCTLRAAIQEANSLAGDDVIDLRADTYVLSLAGASEQAAATGDLDITGNLKILGSGETSTIIDGGQIDRVFHLIGNIDVTISGVTVRNGLTPAGQDGGGILVDDNATLTLSDSTVEENTAAHWGGGVHSGANATTTMTSVLIQENTAGTLGGGVDNYDGTLTIRQSQILNNEVTSGPGGGVYNGSGGTTTIEETTIDGNQASVDGGGVYNLRPNSQNSGSLIIRRTTISNNKATLNGGGLYNFGLLTELQNTTISGNTANDDGGGLYNAKTITLINHVTIYNNTASAQGGGLYNDINSIVTLQNSIVANNSNDNCKAINPIMSGGHNIESANSCGLNATGDEIHTDPILGVLADHGGSTYTHEPAANSPAIDQASTVGRIATDQRGISRPQGDGHDIGAFEHEMADLSVSKSDDPDPVYAGQMLTYTLTVANAGQSDALSVQLSDTLPADTTFVSASGTGWSCSHLSGVVSCDKTVLRVGQSSTVILKIMAPDEGGIMTNEAGVGSATTDLKMDDNQVSQSTTVTAVANLSLAKSDDVDPVNAAGALEYSLQVSNAGPSIATNLVVTDTLMAGVTYVRAEGAGWSCGYDNGLRVVTCTRSSLAVGSAPVITLDVIAPDDDGQLYNVAGVTSGVVDLDRSNNQAGEYTTVTPVADLSVAKSDLADPVYASESLTYLLTIENNGPSTAKSVVLTDTLPAGTTFVSVNPSDTSWSCAYQSSSHMVTCTQPSFAVGPAQTIQIVVNAPAEGGTINNNVTVASEALDLNAGNNTSSEETIITPKTDLSVTQSHSPSSLYAQEQLTYQVQVHNAGPSTATSLVMSSRLPSDVTILSASGTGWTCSFNQATHQVTCTRSSLSTGDAPEIAITVTGPAEGGVTVNHADIQGATYDPNTSNNLATEDVTVIAVADLAITQSDSPDPVEASEQLIYTLNVVNNGPSRASAVIVTDTLPSAVQFVSASGIRWNCSHESNFNILTCSYADDLLSGGSSTIEVVVTAPAESQVVTNQARVASSTLDFATANDNSSESTTVGSVAGLSLDVSGTPSVVDAGEHITYTIEIYNHGPSAATSVMVTDQLPDEVTFVQAEGSGWSCRYESALHDVICSRDSVAIGLAPAITIIGKSPAQASTVSNLATVTAMTPDPDLVNDNVDTVEVEVRPVADLSVDISDHSDTVNAKTSLLYQVRVDNAGPSLSQAIELQFDLPVGASYNSASGTGWTCEVDERGRVTCVRANLASLTTSLIDIVATAPTEGGEITASAIISSGTLDKNLSNNSATEQTTVTALADLALSMNEFPEAVGADSVVTIILTATNAGPSTAESIRIVNTLSNQLEYVSATGSGWSCSYSSDDHEVICTLNQLAVGVAPIITIQAIAPDDVTDLHNTAYISSDTLDSDSSNNSVTTEIAVDGQVDLSLTIHDTPDPINAQTTMTYTLSAVNHGPSDAYGVMLSATLPVSATYMNSSGAWSCSHQSGTVTCSRGSLDNQESSTLTLILTSPPDGGMVTLAASIASDTAETNTSNNSASENTTVVAVANLSIRQQDHPDPVYAAHPLSYTLSIRNHGPSRVPNVQVIDTLPPESAFVKAEGSGWVCEYEGNSHRVTCLRAKELPVGDAPEIVILLRAPSRGGFLDNTVRVVSSVQDLDPSDNSDTEGTDVTPVADLSLRVQDEPDPVYAGQALSYNLEVHNAGPSVAELVTVTHQLPPEVVFSQVAAEDWHCAYEQFDHVVNCYLANFALGIAKEIDIVVTSPTYDVRLNSKTSIQSSILDLDLSNNQEQEETIVTSGTDLSISSMTRPKPLGIGQPVTHYLRVENVGPGEAREVQATVILHQQVTFNSCPGANCSYQNGFVSYELPDMAVGHTEYLTLTVTPRRDDGMIMMASVKSAVPEINLDNNETEMSMNLHYLHLPVISSPSLDRVDLSVNVTENAYAVYADDTLFYTLESRNSQPYVAKNVVIQAALPEQATFISAQGVGWTCEHKNGTVTCSRAYLVIGTAPPIMLAIMPPPDDQLISLTANIENETYDINLENNRSTVQTAVIPAADLSITQTDNVDPVEGEAQFVYEVTVTNHGPSIAPQIGVRDILPDGVEFIHAVGTEWFCNQSKLIVNCTRSTPLAAENSATLFMVVKAPRNEGIIENRVRTTSTIMDPDPSNNSAMERTRVE